VGEPLKETLIREVKEETGLDVELDEMAFITEWYMSSRKEWYLQFYFSVTVVGGEAGVQLEDQDVTQVRWVPQDQVRNYMNYPPWVEPLYTWLKERRPRYHLLSK
jgi:8-oxo-dGTP diphosphatase